MADQNDAQERTEQPTPKKLQDARNKGQIARSRELSTMLVLMLGALTIFTSGQHVLTGLSEVMRSSFALSKAEIFDYKLVQVRFMHEVIAGLSAIAPILVVATLIALAAPLALGGWSFSTKALAPKMERVDPLKGLKRVFGVKGLMELVKALAKFVLIMSFAVIALRHEQSAILNLSRGDVYTALVAASSILLFTFVACSSATMVVALIDVPFQLWQHTKQLRMSHKEIKDELKETDGSPELKNRVRNMQHEVSRRRMMEQVPEADVVITNPEHYAVALKFDPDAMRAPVVVALGVEIIAANIRKVAAAHDIQIVEAPPLARALYHTTKLNAEIPAGLYVAVARVLAYVFQIRDGMSESSLPDDLPIPPEYIY